MIESLSNVLTKDEGLHELLDDAQRQVANQLTHPACKADNNDVSKAKITLTFTLYAYCHQMTTGLNREVKVALPPLVAEEARKKAEKEVEVPGQLELLDAAEDRRRI